MRAFVPSVVGVKDVGPAVSLLELSQLVRDLCRQHDLDRIGWVQATAAINHQADRIEVLEHEALQTTDDVPAVLEGHLQAFRGSEQALQNQLKGAFLDMTTAVMAVEQGLLAGINLVADTSNQCELSDMASHLVISAQVTLRSCDSLLADMMVVEPIRVESIQSVSHDTKADLPMPRPELVAILKVSKSTLPPFCLMWFVRSWSTSRCHLRGPVKSAKGVPF